MRVPIREASFPDQPGVYIVYDVQEGGRPLYVGLAATQTLRARWNQHLSLRSGSSALRRSLALHLGLVNQKLKRPERYHAPEIEAELTRRLEAMWIELRVADDAERAFMMEVEAIDHLDPVLNIVRPTPAQVAAARRTPSTPPQPCAPLPKTPATNGCGRPSPSVDDDLNDLVDDYLAQCYPGKEVELEHYARLSYDDALRQASQAKDARGKRHSHQRRLTTRALDETFEWLSRTDLRRCADFHELFTTIENTIRPIRGIGALMVYDTAIRLGANLGLEPERVYLHSGAHKGALALGVDPKAIAVDVRELPPELGRLTPLQIEDFLCIYKERFEARAA